MKDTGRLWLVLAGLVVLAALAQFIRSPVVAPSWSEDFEESVLQGDGFRDVEISDATMSMLGMDRYRFVELREDGWAPVWIYAGYWAGQRSNAQVHPPEHCYPGSGWKIVRSESRVLHASRLRELTIAHNGRRRLVWYAYQTRLGRRLTPFGLKLDQMRAVLTGRPRDAVLLRMSTPILEVDGLDGARARLQRTWERHALAVLDWFEQEGGS